MRAGVIQRIVARLLWFTAGSLVIPLGTAVLYQDGVWWAFAVPMATAALAAFVISRLPAASQVTRYSLFRREAFLAVVLGWLILVLHTAAAFYLTGAFAGFAEAFFEAMSGFTTTGASVVADVESLPASVLLQRSFAHWVGGMGILVLSVAILPELSVGGMQLFAAESSELVGDKLAPRISATARRFSVLYIVITTIQTLLLLPAMSAFDAINHAMATVGTGGFSTKSTSVAYFDSLYVECVILAFMLISGIGFTVQYLALVRGRVGDLFRDAEVRLYLLLIAGSIAIIALALWVGTPRGAAESLRQASFQVVSIATTTGFVTDDFDQWPDVCRLLLVAIMLIGGCSGSTAGGSKVIRLYLVAKHAIGELHRLVRPRIVEPLRVGNHEISREATEGVLGFYLLFFAAILIGSLLLTAVGMDLVSGTTAAISAMNSVGPGLASVGAVKTFGEIPDLGLYALSFGMLLGRLEIYTVLVLFSAHFWRRG